MASGSGGPHGWHRGGCYFLFWTACVAPRVAPGFRLARPCPSATRWRGAGLHQIQKNKGACVQRFFVPRACVHVFRCFFNMHSCFGDFLFLFLMCWSCCRGVHVHLNIVVHFVIEPVALVAVRFLWTLSFFFVFGAFLCVVLHFVLVCAVDSWALDFLVVCSSFCVCPQFHLGAFVPCQNFVPVWMC